jgi:hypothetical protein
MKRGMTAQSGYVKLSHIDSSSQRGAILTNENTLAANRYLFQFIGAYVLCSAIIFAITTLLNFDVPSSMGIITLIASTAPVVQSFVKREQRLPSKGERARFALLATTASLALSALAVLAMLSVYSVGPMEALQTLGIPLWGAALLAVIAILVSWLVLYFFTGFMSKQALKQIEKAKAK